MTFFFQHIKDTERNAVKERERESERERERERKRGERHKRYMIRREAKAST